MNITNANAEFQDFSKCNYNLHWSWSNFFRHIAVCNSMLDFPHASNVLEIGAADSPIQKMLEVNFNKHLIFTKTDVNEQYSNSHAIFNIETEGLERYFNESFECVIFTEVLEHIHPHSAQYVLQEIKRVLKKGGKLLLTTPTPQKPKEQLVWPSDHEFEYSLIELFDLLLECEFAINKVMPWSQHLTDYTFKKKTTSECLPESLNRAISSLSADLNLSRQIFFELIKEI